MYGPTQTTGSIVNIYTNRTGATESIVLDLKPESTVVIYSRPRRYGESRRDLDFKRALRQLHFVRMSRALARESHPDRLPSSRKPPAQPLISQNFHWMTQRKRCFRMRAPIRGYDRA